MADFYENLYSKKPIEHHHHHDTVKTQLNKFETDFTKEEEWYNQPPTEGEILDIIENRKNGKATTDVRNEILKKNKVEFTKILMPVIQAVWETEEIPLDWNKGQITSIWKGKGDKECLEKHRGITVSSTIGAIMEEALDRRMEKIVKFSQGQAGGKKGASTADHLFLLRGILTLAIEEKRNVFLTFYDVAKAYDNADVENMLHVIWQAGIQGKIWRLLKNMNTNLSAVVKTKFGPSRPITRENGGKQGSRLMGRLFAKQMDVLSENCIEKDDENLHINDDLNIGCLEFVDDVLSSTEGVKNQKNVLSKVNEFGKMNKLEWGAEKCQVMQVGKKVVTPDTWNLGDKQIKNTSYYKYLGDTITNDNKNKKLIETRENAVNAVVRQINTVASSDVMREIESQVILNLYEKCVVPSLVNNSESWTLSPTEEKRMDEIGIQAVKRLFNLTTTTPSVAILHSFGLLFITQIIDEKRFLYLHKILNREQEHWTKLMLLHLNTKNVGWAKSINEKLQQYGLETNWNMIKIMTKNEWKEKVRKSILEINGFKLITQATSKTPQGDKIKTKTRDIHNKLTSTPYSSKPTEKIVAGTNTRAKTIILARKGMLQCGRNFKGTMNESCSECNVTDDEEHRLNACSKWNDTNNSNTTDPPHFIDVYSEDEETLKVILKNIEKVWEMRYANGKMKTNP